MTDLTGDQLAGTPVLDLVGKSPSLAGGVDVGAGVDGLVVVDVGDADVGDADVGDAEVGEVGRVVELVGVGLPPDDADENRTST